MSQIVSPRSLSSLQRSSFPSRSARWILLAGLAGCTPTAPADKSKPAATDPKAKDGGTTGAAANPEADPANQADPVPAAQTGVELHEWGLIGTAIADPLGRVHLASGPRAKAAAAPSAIDPGMMGVGKPVIYAHLVGDKPVKMSVTVRALKSDIVEHWPATTLETKEDQALIRWDATVLRNEDCLRAPWPAPDEPACAAVVDSYCEQLELPAYATEDGDCIAVGEGGYDLLFYRAASTRQQLAVVAQRDAKDVIRVQAREGSAAPKSVLWVRRKGDEVKVTQLDLGPEGVALDSDAADNGAGTVIADPTAWLSDQLLAGGLTSDEKLAFMRAWELALLAPLAAPSDAPMPPVGLAPSAEALLYIMTREEIDGLVALDVDPAPIALKRVFLAHIDLSPPVTR